MIFLILSLGIFLRLISLNQSLWLDEATSALVSQMTLSEMFTKFFPGDFHPPFYYLILKLWSNIFGYGEVSLRMPSVIFGVATIYLVYKLGLLKSKFVANAAALLVATSGLFVYYSQEARMYSLAAFLVALSVYFFLKSKWFLFSVALLLIAMTDYVALFVTPVFILQFREKRWGKLARAFAPLAIGFLVWSPTFVKQISLGLSVQGSGWWNLLGVSNLKNIFLIPVKFILGRISFDNKFFYASVCVILVSLFGYLILSALKDKSSKMFAYWLFVPVVVGVVVSFFIPTLSYFRFLFCLPAFYILVASGIESFARYKKYLLIFVVSVNLVTTFGYLLNRKFQREDWREASSYIASEKIIFPNPSQKEALIYYGMSGQIIDIKDFEGNEENIWLSRYVWEIFDPEDNSRKKVEELGYNKTAEHNFNGVLFYKYTKN